MLDFDVFEALTFDCYGTLIDWEQGIFAALAHVLGSGVIAGRSREEVLELFGRLEAEAEGGEYRPYREVLSSLAAGIGRELGAIVGRSQAAEFAASVAT